MNARQKLLGLMEEIQEAGLFDVGSHDMNCGFYKERFLLLKQVEIQLFFSI